MEGNERGKWRGGKIYAFNMNSADSNGKGIRIQAGGLMIRSGELTQNQQRSREREREKEEGGGRHACHI